jgi:hypothetical protein
VHGAFRETIYLTHGLVPGVDSVDIRSGLRPVRNDIAGDVGDGIPGKRQARGIHVGRREEQQ